MRSKSLFVFLAEMNLHGILTFSSEIRPAVGGVGSVIITSQFIHNYPLIYAFNGKLAEAYTVIPSLHLPVKRRPHIRPLQYTFITEVLREIKHGRLKYIYTFPAIPLKVTTKKFFMAAKGTGYAEPVRAGLKTVFPMSTNWISLVPPTKHLTVLISPRRLPRATYIRIGMKRMGLYKVKLREVKSGNIKRVDELEWSSIPVNLYDVRLFNYSIEDFVKVLETRSAPLNGRDMNIVGYIRTRGLYEVADNDYRLLLPLPKNFEKQLMTV